jgi:hypothetical protein
MIPVSALAAGAVKYLPAIIGGVSGAMSARQDASPGPYSGAPDADFTPWWQDLLGFLVPGTQWNLGEVTPEVRAVSDPGGGVVKQWYTGTCRFFLLADGTMASLSNDGQVRQWKPRGPIVMKREPSVRELSGQVKRVKKLAQSANEIYHFAEHTHSHKIKKGKR